MSGWVLRGANGDAPITFRLRPGSVRTIGRAPRADFIVDATGRAPLHARAARDLLDAGRQAGAGAAEG